MNSTILDRKNKYYSRVYDDNKRLKVPKKQISFFVTENCNLNCSYCYLPGKNIKNKMSFNVARKAIDFILSEKIQFPEQITLLDFIGGEPLLEIELIEQIVDYFKVASYHLNHPYFDNYKLMITTNGTLFKTPAFEKFLKKNLDNIFIGISIDGNKEKHDGARKYAATGKGSYDDVIEGYRYLRTMTSNCNIKATFASDDLKHLKSSIISLIDTVGADIEIFANVVYEDVWKDGDDLLLETQLKELADYLIDNNLYNQVDIGFFTDSEAMGRPYAKDQLAGHWCNSGHQISVGSDGSFYPCNRFQQLSLKHQKARTIGHVDTGIDYDKLRPFRVLALNNCSDASCIACEVATGCGMCTGLCYDESEIGTIFHRTTHICKMHKARHRANQYYWERLRKEKNFIAGNKKPYIAQIQNSRKVINVLLASDSPAICNYNTDVSQNQLIDINTLKNTIDLCKKENYFINFLYPNLELPSEYSLLIENSEHQKTLPYNNQNGIYPLDSGNIFVFKVGQKIQPGFSCLNVILSIDFFNLSMLSEYISELFKSNITRVNFVFDIRKISIDFDFETYRDQLEKISDVIFDYFKSGKPKFLSALTDILNLEKMNNCEAGTRHMTLGPDGNYYLCPAFYYLKQPIREKAFDLSRKLKKSLEFDSAVICRKCDAFHCKRCVYDNLARTFEYNIPGEVQCVISHIEREMSLKLQQRLKNELNIDAFPNKLIEKDYIDPFTVAKIW